MANEPNVMSPRDFPICKYLALYHVRHHRPFFWVVRRWLGRPISIRLHIYERVTLGPLAIANRVM